MSDKTLIIYDLNGTIIQQVTGFYKVPNGVPFIEVVIPQGKRVVSVNVETKEPILEDIPPSEIELLQNKISILEDEQLVQNDEILTSMLATSDLFEIVLNMSSPSTMSIEENNKNIGGNNMVELYVTLILKGAKTIDQIPAVIREQVQKQLDLLTK